MIPEDFATIYDLPASVNGSGETIAIVGQTQISTSDIDEFRSAAAAFVTELNAAPESEPVYAISRHECSAYR